MRLGPVPGLTVSFLPVLIALFVACTGYLSHPSVILLDMGACDLHLLVAPSFSPPLVIDVRTKIRFDYSYIESAVVQLGEETLEVTSFGDYFLDGVGGADLSSGISGFPVNHTQVNDKVHKFEISVSMKEKIVVKVRHLVLF